MCASVLLLSLINIPIGGGNGYIHLGDAAVLLCACLLPQFYACAAAGIGSALADIILGFSVYAPASLFIKAVACLLVCLLLRAFKGKVSAFALLLGSVIIAPLYYLYESLLLSIGPTAIINLLPNLIQSTVGAILSIIAHRLICRRA